MGWMLGVLLGLAAPPVAAVAQEAPATSDARLVLAGSPCAVPALALLRAWSADLDHGLADPPGPTGARGVRMPTAAIGAWARVAVEPSGLATVERIAADGVDTHRFGAGCRPVQTRTPGGAPEAGAFTDERLAARLDRGDDGVVLVWSPHMPLSVDEYGELQAVAGALRLSLVAVLDPAADAGYARRVAAERGLPDSALARLASIELAFRGMTTHAPSVQVFAGGRLVGPVLYGYRNRETARAAIAAVLAGR